MRRSVAAVAGVILGSLLLTGCGSDADSGGGVANDAASGITAEGTGTVSATPDTLTVRLGVHTEGATAQAALSDNNTRATALVGALQRAGVQTPDVQTSGLSIDAATAPGGGPVTGYQVDNTVTAKLHDLAKAGAVIDAAAAAAGDAVRVQQVGFSISDDSALRDKAREQAVQQAKAHAQQLAKAAGVSLGPLRSIREGAPSVPGPGPLRQATPTAPIEPGQQQVDATVTVVYGIG